MVGQAQKSNGPQFLRRIRLQTGHCQKESVDWLAGAVCESVVWLAAEWAGLSKQAEVPFVHARCAYNRLQ